MQAITRYRTIKQCLWEIRNLDSESALTEWYIRSLCKSGKIDYLANGTKSLVNLDSLFNFLNNGEINTNEA